MEVGSGVGVEDGVAVGVAIISCVWVMVGIGSEDVTAPLTLVDDSAEVRPKRIKRVMEVMIPSAENFLRLIP